MVTGAFPERIYRIKGMMYNMGRDFIATNRETERINDC